jgi:hypothetical protein
LAGAALRIALSGLAACLLAAGTANAEPAVSIEIKDLTPKFLAFYEAAEKEQANPDRRWDLWKSLYGFAAVPPTPAGDRMARAMLDAAWPKYPAALPQIRAGLGGLRLSPEKTLESVAALLKTDKPVHIELIAYVGALENNAFTYADKGLPIVAIPVEDEPLRTSEMMAHEMTHAVQISMGTMAGGYERTIGETVLAEGLAMRAARSLFPAQPEADFVEARPGWLAEAAEKRGRILLDVRAVLNEKGADTVTRFTMGQGPSGIEREAYYIAWLVSGYWLSHGETFAEIARVKEIDAPTRVAEAIDHILTEMRH